MNTFGFLTLSPESEKAYSTEIARRAEKYQFKVVRFTPFSIQPTTERVIGEHYNIEKQTWQKAEFEIPEVIYDRCLYNLDERAKKGLPIINWLRNRPGAHFLGYGLPSKWNVIAALLKDQELQSYIPTTIRASSVDHVFEFLNKERNTILKPEFGSAGKGIFALSTSMLAKSITIIRNNRKDTLALADAKKLLTSILNQTPYLMQPLLDLTENGKPFDVRLLLQKDEHGNWQEQGRGLRFGARGTITSNLAQGGVVKEFSSWINKKHTYDQLLIRDGIETIMTKLPLYLEQQFAPMFEVGIDLGFAKDGSTWLLDVNSKPGRKVILETSPEKSGPLYEAPLKYARFIVNGAPARKESEL